MPVNQSRGDVPPTTSDTRRRRRLRRRNHDDLSLKIYRHRQAEDTYLVSNFYTTRNFIPQWDEQVVGPEAAGKHDRTSEPPKPLPRSDPMMKDAFQHCQRCCLTWLSSSVAGDPSPRPHPYHDACHGPIPKTPAVERRPLASIVVHLATHITSIDGAKMDQDNDGHAKAFSGIYFGCNSPANRVEYQILKGKQQDPKVVKETVFVNTALKTLRCIHKEILPAYRATIMTTQLAERARRAEERRRELAKTPMNHIAQVRRDHHDIVCRLIMTYFRLVNTETENFLPELADFMKIYSDLRSHTIKAEGTARARKHLPNLDLLTSVTPGCEDWGAWPSILALRIDLTNHLSMFAHLQVTLEAADLLRDVETRLKDINKRLDERHNKLMDHFGVRVFDIVAASDLSRDDADTFDASLGEEMFTKIQAIEADLMEKTTTIFGPLALRFHGDFDWVTDHVLDVEREHYSLWGIDMANLVAQRWMRLWHFIKEENLDALPRLHDNLYADGVIPTYLGLSPTAHIGEVNMEIGEVVLKALQQLTSGCTPGDRLQVPPWVGLYGGPDSPEWYRKIVSKAKGEDPTTQESSAGGSTKKNQTKTDSTKTRTKRDSAKPPAATKNEPAAKKNEPAAKKNEPAAKKNEPAAKEDPPKPDPTRRGKIKDDPVRECAVKEAAYPPGLDDRNLDGHPENLQVLLMSPHDWSHVICRRSVEFSTQMIYEELVTHEKLKWMFPKLDKKPTSQQQNGMPTPAPDIESLPEKNQYDFKDWLAAMVRQSEEDSVEREWDVDPCSASPEVSDDEDLVYCDAKGKVKRVPSAAAVESTEKVSVEIPTVNIESKPAKPAPAPWPVTKKKRTDAGPSKTAGPLGNSEPPPAEEKVQVSIRLPPGLVPGCEVATMKVARSKGKDVKAAAKELTKLVAAVVVNANRKRDGMVNVEEMIHAQLDKQFEQFTLTMRGQLLETGPSTKAASVDGPAIGGPASVDGPAFIDGPAFVDGPAAAGGSGASAEAPKPFIDKQKRRRRRKDRCENGKYKWKGLEPIRIIIVTDSSEMVESICKSQESWRFEDTLVDEKGRFRQPEPALRNGRGKVVVNESLWLQFWEAVFGLVYYQNAYVSWYLVPPRMNKAARDYLDDSVRIVVK